MADFTPIETQEQLDSIIRDRIDRAKKSAREEAEAKYSDYDELKTSYESLTQQVTDLTNQLTEAGTKAESSNAEMDELKAKVAKYEIDSVKTEVAAKMGLGFDALQFLQGEDEEAITKSAEKLKALVGTKQVAPLADPESTPEEDGVTKAFRKLNPNIEL